MFLGESLGEGGEQTRKNQGEEGANLMGERQVGHLDGLLGPDGEVVHAWSAVRQAAERSPSGIVAEGHWQELDEKLTEAVENIRGIREADEEN